MPAERETIGLIGIGLLGTALAERLLHAGRAVVGFDTTPARREALKTLGGRPAESSQAVAASARTIVLSLPDSSVVEAVVNEILPCCVKGTLFLDTTTGDPERTAALGERLAGGGACYVDATLAGSSELVRQGEAIVMAGGAAAAFEKSRAVLATFAKRVFHVGPCGSGARMKLVANLVLGLNRAVLAEGLALAKAAGLDPAASLQVLKAGPAYSTVMDTKGYKMLSEDFRPEARLAQHLKDVRLILELGERARAQLPLSELHQQLLERAIYLGYAEADNSAIIKAFEPT